MARRIAGESIAVRPCIHGPGSQASVRVARGRIPLRLRILMADTDRAYVAQYAQETLGLGVTVASVPTDAQGPVTVTVSNEDTLAILFERVADHDGVGQYSIDLTPDDTALVGNYRALWVYQVNGALKTFNGYYAVGGGQPAYDQLAPNMKSVVDHVWIRFCRTCSTRPRAARTCRPTSRPTGHGGGWPS